MDELRNQPRVSVIMPAYNAERFIDEAISSVLSQTMTDWELIVIDDCSEDSSFQIAQNYANKDSRIRVLKNPENSGVAKTRNRGLDLFHGQYVAFLDSDDYWEPQMLEKMLSRAEETWADIVYCSYSLIDENGKKVCNDFIVPPKTLFKDSIVRSVITCSTVLITADLAKGNRFPTDMYHEDIAMWFQILRDGATACGVTEILAAYRQRKDSRSGNKIISAFRRWSIYRKHLEMPFIQSVKAMVGYAYYGLLKFKRL